MRGGPKVKPGPHACKMSAHVADALVFTHVPLQTNCSLKSAPLPTLTGINPDLSPAAILTSVLFTTVRFPMISRRRKLSSPELQQ